ncbi:amidohydrolase [Pseudoroseomonas wenyumeiae]|uniref:Amidohydrolase n=1 Tax=Teichococcus wenyumeiae TaxID=2478470 RepID=A0A3A9JD48_9PROT|nr:amidohydrolase [Pseudoroseomonas wenyumeiae]RKK03351.1 amidohydrolase [Pseudoroseomonas wenyumeiae]RMI16889.1 amidohydrolase [Pseudoroseomonas wenyumeiae]
MTVPQELVERLVAWRRHLHANPEPSNAEVNTAAFVCERLAELGIPFTSGVGGHGVVGTLSRGEGSGSVGLRADMDALSLVEETQLPYRSTRLGVMHACGHDGHTTALLGAAALLAERDDWSGTVQLIFQPAEEAGTGARAMLDDGLLERFPMQRIFAFHNWPGLSAGTVAARIGAMTAGTAKIEIVLTGTASHAALPQRAKDPVLAAAHLIIALQSVVSRETDPLDSAVLSICTMQAGTVLNQIPETVTLRGTMRLHRPEVRESMEAAMRRICDGVGAAFGVDIECRIQRGSTPSANSPAETRMALDAAQQAGLVADDDPPRAMIGEDFNWMLARRPGALVWIGNGPAEGGRELHSPTYDFEDSALPAAAAWLAEVACTALADESSAPPA